MAGEFGSSFKKIHLTNKGVTKRKTNRENWPPARSCLFVNWYVTAARTSFELLKFLSISGIGRKVTVESARARLALRLR